MKNILFYLHGDCRPEVGGIERVTDILCGYFRRIGHKCVLIYQEDADSHLKRTEFDAYYYLPSNAIAQITEIIKREEIDIIINQEEYFVSSQIYEAVRDSGRNCKIIFAYHNTPLKVAKASVAFDRILKNYKEEHRLQDLIKLLCYPIYRVYNLNSVRKQYRETSLKCDVNVMLADCYIEPWYKAANIKETQRKHLAPVIAINNPLSFSVERLQDVLYNKEKRVLILSRLYEPAKKISTALKIWRELEKDSRYDDWRLDIVGEGPDRHAYESYASKNLNRATFWGRQEPQSYYQRSSIYMLTSDYEGWPMTLIEAMQHGCVPIVFDSFDSLHDIIQSDMSECIIKKGDNAMFLSRLKEFISDDRRRTKLAQTGKDSTDRFKVEDIGKQWIELFNRL